jgi:hypothetical protein
MTFAPHAAWIVQPISKAATARDLEARRRRWGAGALLDDGEHSVAAQLPMVNHSAQSLPHGESGEGLAISGHESPHLLIPEDRDVGFQIVQGGPAEEEAVGFKGEGHSQHEVYAGQRKSAWR